MELGEQMGVRTARGGRVNLRRPDADTDGPPPPVGTARGDDDVIGRPTERSSLHDSGIVGRDHFAAATAGVLASARDSRTTPASSTLAGCHRAWQGS